VAFHDKRDSDQGFFLGLQDDKNNILLFSTFLRAIEITHFQWKFHGGWSQLKISQKPLKITIFGGLA
jgi:hypothetical protein